MDYSLATITQPIFHHMHEMLQAVTICYLESCVHSVHVVLKQMMCKIENHIFLFVSFDIDILFVQSQRLLYSLKYFLDIVI